MGLFRKAELKHTGVAEYTLYIESYRSPMYDTDIVGTSLVGVYTEQTFPLALEAQLNAAFEEERIVEQEKQESLRQEVLQT